MILDTSAHVSFSSIISTLVGSLSLTCKFLLSSLTLGSDFTFCGVEGDSTATGSVILANGRFLVDVIVSDAMVFVAANAGFDTDAVRVA